MAQANGFDSWRKSTLSGGSDNCVEVAFAPDGRTGVRHSKHQSQGPVLVFTRAEWLAFLGGVRQGEFDQEPG